MYLKLGLLIIITIYFAYDVIVDLLTDEQFEIDILIEAFMFSAATTLLVTEILKNQRVTVALEETQIHNKLLSSQLSDIIESRLSSWNLTKAESETAWLLIKGFSINEISKVRHVKEKTVHHQLTSIYSKSKTRNRSDFTSQFIQALFDASQQSK